MKDPFNLFIEDSVYLVEHDYYKLMYKTKLIFFNYLLNDKSIEDFKKRTNRMWNKIDHSYMEQRIKELDDMIKQTDLEGKKILNPDEKFEKIYEVASISKYKETESRYKKIIDNYYARVKNTLNKDYIDKKAYLSKIVEKYDSTQQTIPYFNKNGFVQSYHNVASYNSMVFNTSLNHAGWNRTAYDSKLLGITLEYLPAHTFACPLCQKWQGKVYSNDGKYGTIDGIKYEPKENAINGGVGHPNCKHQWLLYWDKNQIQTYDYSSNEWKDRYQARQKKQALELKRKRLKTDRDIYKELNNYEEVDKINAQIRTLNSTIKEQKELMK